MWIFSVVKTIQPFAALLLGIIGTGFTVLFAIERIGTKVKVAYSPVFSQLTAKRIGYVTLINCKNKPVTIFGIVAVIDKGNILAPVEDLSPPLILKPLETAQIETKAFSAYLLGLKPYVADFNPRYAVLYLLLEHRLVKCEITSTPHHMHFKNLRKLQPLTKDTRRFNDHVYNGNALFAITHRDGTAFVMKGGVIGGDWGFRFNVLREEDTRSKETVRRALEGSGMATVIGNFIVDELEPALYEKNQS